MCDRAVHIERQVRPAPIVISNIVGKNPSQMVFAEDNDVVQTLSPNGPVESLRIRIWTSNQLHVIETLSRELSV
jgi:hypothetical protein